MTLGKRLHVQWLGLLGYRATSACRVLEMVGQWAMSLGRESSWWLFRSPGRGHQVNRVILKRCSWIGSPLRCGTQGETKWLLLWSLETELFGLYVILRRWFWNGRTLDHDTQERPPSHYLCLTVSKLGFWLIRLSDQLSICNQAVASSSSLSCVQQFSLNP